MARTFFGFFFVEFLVVYGCHSCKVQQLLITYQGGNFSTRYGILFDFLFHSRKVWHQNLKSEPEICDPCSVCCNSEAISGDFFQIASADPMVGHRKLKGHVSWPGSRAKSGQKIRSEKSLMKPVKRNAPSGVRSKTGRKIKRGSGLRLSPIVYLEPKWLR